MRVFGHAGEEKFQACPVGFSFTDDAAQWWEVSGSTRPDGSSVLHGGIGASGGSNTKVVVTSIADGFFLAPDYFADQIIEVEVLSGVWEARPIKIQNAAATKSFEIYDTVPPFSHTTVGKNWRLPQAAYVRNRWIDRKVTFTKLDGTQVVVAGNGRGSRQARGQSEHRRDVQRRLVVGVEHA